MNGLVQYGSSDSEDEPEPAPQPPRETTKRETVTASVVRPLGGSILASEFQLRMLSKQRSKAAKDGSKKRIFITAPNLEELDESDHVSKVKKPKMVKSTKRSLLFAQLPRPQQSANQMSSKVTIDRAETSAEEPSTSSATSAPTKPTTSLMPNSVKKRLEKAAKEVQKPVLAQSDSDESDDEGGFFSFKTKEEDEEELRKHAARETGPKRPTRDMLRSEREKFVEKPADHVRYDSTRHPQDVEDSAIAPYGRDLAGYQAIAGPIRRQSDQMELDAGLDIEGEAIRKLQGRRHEEVQFVDAQVDKSLGNIRENIRKGANQKHISTSIVDPLKTMKKTDPNAHVSKRTHQLKYLVELAKANETRLNQLWSNAKNSSRTTAQKYGW